MLKKITLTILLMTCALFAQSSAQTVADAEKQTAIKELLAVMDSNVKVSDLMNIMNAQMDETAKAVFNATLAENKDMTAEDKKICEDLFFKNGDSVYKRYQEKLLTKIDFDALIKEMVYSIYDKHFALAELKDLTAFYKSPTGQKLLKATPLILQDSMQAMTEKLIPKMLEVNKEIEAEMKKEIEVKVKEQMSKKKKAQTE